MATPVFILTPEDLEAIIAKVIRREVGQMLNDPSISDSLSEENWTKSKTAKFWGCRSRSLLRLP